MESLADLAEKIKASQTTCFAVLRLEPLFQRRKAKTRTSAPRHYTAGRYRALLAFFPATVHVSIDSARLVKSAPVKIVPRWKDFDMPESRLDDLISSAKEEFWKER
jgi:hypothetical protein